MASSREAQAELRLLEERWEVEGSVGRRALRPELDQFVEEYERDPSVARARIMLAQIALLERRFGSAEEGLAPLLEGPKGNSRDEALVILAAIDRERGNYEEALARLEPLAGKLLTRKSRDQYSQVRTSAAIDARRWRLSVDVMIDWLSESEPETAHVQRWIESIVVQVPSRALSRLLNDWEQEEARPEQKKARDWLHRVLIRRLTDEALSDKDPLLARDLLRRAPPWLRGSKEGNELAELAALAQKESRVSGRAVGLVLGGKSDEQRRRSLKIVSGLMQGLGLGFAHDSPGHLRLLTAEDRGSISSALDSLSGLGATILVAGMDELGAQEALSFAETRHVPVVTMSEVTSPVRLKYGFMFGVGKLREKEAMERSMPPSTKWLFVGDQEQPCRRPGERPSSRSFPVRKWRSAAVGAIGVLGAPSCVRRLARQLSELGWRPALVAGLDASHLSFQGHETLSNLRVGHFPSPELSSSERSGSETEPGSGNSQEIHRSKDWYTTLGMDLALLIREAMMTLPDSSVTDKDQVKVRHEQARSALLLARATLATASARGFSAEQRIPREFFVGRVGVSMKSSGDSSEP